MDRKGSIQLERIRILPGWRHCFTADRVTPGQRIRITYISGKSPLFRGLFSILYTREAVALASA
jgi:hypothetical protein